MADYVYILCQVGEKNSPERKRADEMLKYVMTPVVDGEFHIDIKRSDLDPTPGQITRQIIEGIINAKVVFADLTGRNPNVYYELGVAQAFGKPTILLIKDAASAPFDVRNERMIVVGDGEQLGAADAEEAKKNLREVLTLVLSDDYRVMNLVVDVAAARSLDELAPSNPIATELSAIRDKLEEMSIAIDSQDTDDRLADFISIKARMEEMVEQGLLHPSHLGNKLVDSTTSLAFDEWARAITDRAAKTWEERQRVARAFPAGKMPLTPKRMPLPDSGDLPYDEEPF